MRNALETCFCLSALLILAGCGEVQPQEHNESLHGMANEAGKPAESDCLNGIDDNGDGLADCQDPTCTNVVTCVPADNPAGILTQEGCPDEFANEETLYRDLNAPASCSGCSC